MYFNKKALIDIPNKLSTARFSSYIAATNNHREALKLYQWNLDISSAYLIPLHFYEVILRNAVSDGISLVYGADWHNNNAFIYSHGRQNKDRLTKAIEYAKESSNSSNPSVGSVIAETTLVFWETMFKSSYDNAIWKPHLNSIFPNALGTLHWSRKRSMIHDATKKIRIVRNRIAHHEPIFNQAKFNHSNIMADIEKIVGWRCQYTAAWLSSKNRISSLISKNPLVQ